MKEMSLEDKQRITKEANEWVDYNSGGAFHLVPSQSESYIAGATREHERMSELLKETVEALEIAQQYVNVFLIRGEDPLVGDQIKDHSYKIITALVKAKGKSQ